MVAAHTGFEGRIERVAFVGGPWKRRQGVHLGMGRPRPREWAGSVRFVEDPTSAQRDHLAVCIGHHSADTGRAGGK
jgi:hypothetical protein